MKRDLEKLQVTNTACERLTFAVFTLVPAVCVIVYMLCFAGGLDFVGVECVWLETFAAGGLRGFARVAANKMPVTLFCVELKLEKCKVMITASSL